MGAVVQVIPQDVGARQVHGADLAGGQVGLGAVLVVPAGGDPGPGDLGDGLGALAVHDGLHVGHALQAGHHQVDGLLAVDAVPGVQGLQAVQEGLALGVVPAGHLREKEGGGDGVLVPDVVPHHVADGLLEGEDDLPLAGLLQLVLLLADELKAGEGVVAGDAVGLGDLSRHVGGHQALDGGGLVGHGPRPALGSDEVVQQQDPGLVAGDLDVAPLSVLHLDGHPVGVGVGAQDEVGVHLLGQIHGQGEGLGVLGVGRLYRGEAAVDDHLLLHAVQVLDPQLTQDVGDLLIPGAVEGGVDHLEGVRHLGHGFLVVDLGQDVGQEPVVHVLAQDGDEALGHGVVVVHGLDVGEHVQGLHLVGDGGGVVGGKLGPVGPVDLVAVVLGGVVAGGDVQPGDAVVLPDGEGELRRGPQRLAKLHGDAVGGHDAGGLPGELVGVEAAVEADGHPPGGLLPALVQDDLGEGLGGVADGVHVHPAQAHAHDPPEAGGAEFQLVKEAVFDLGLVAGQGGQLGVLLGGEGVAFQPVLVGFLIGHRDSPSCEI